VWNNVEHMRVLALKILHPLLALGLILTELALSSLPAAAQSVPNLAALQGLVPFSTLLSTSGGKAALASNYTTTRDIELGKPREPRLVPLPAQREQALKDAFITGGNGSQLADGLGTSLGAAYAKLAAYTSTDDGKTSSFTSISPSVANLIAYTDGLSGGDSAAAKYFFGNATVSSAAGPTPISGAAAAILSAAGGTTDIMGKAYQHPAGSPGADPDGDSRPYQTEGMFATFSGTDYFGAASTNLNYLKGPAQNLNASPSFPSGHTTYGYTESLLLAMMVPERYSEMIARGAEYGNDRIVLGAHYAMDVLGGRTLAYYDVAHLLAEHPDYVGKIFDNVTITDYQAALRSAKADLTKALELACGGSVSACAHTDTSRFHDPAADERFYEATQTYGLARVFASTAATVEDVAAIAPEAGYLLTAAFPRLSLAQADRILTDTEGPGGGFLDNGSSFGLYSRLDLFAAGKRAAKLASTSG
jgi:hypothetical protein